MACWRLGQRKEISKQQCADQDRKDGGGNPCGIDERGPDVRDGQASTQQTHRKGSGRTHGTGFCRREEATIKSTNDEGKQDEGGPDAAKRGKFFASLRANAVRQKPRLEAAYQGYCHHIHRHRQNAGQYACD